MSEQRREVDAFNPALRERAEFLRKGIIDPGLERFDVDSLGNDQGPIVLMIENDRSGLVRDVMMKNPHIIRGLRRAGFRGGWLE